MPIFSFFSIADFNTFITFSSKSVSGFAISTRFIPRSFATLMPTLLPAP